MTWHKLWWLALLIGCQPTVTTLERDPRWTLTDYLHALEAQKDKS